MANEIQRFPEDMTYKGNPSYDDKLMIYDAATGITKQTNVEDFVSAAGNNVIGTATPSSSPTGTETNGQSYRVSNTTGAILVFPNFLDSASVAVQMAADERSGFITKNPDGWAYIDNTAQTDTSGLMESGSYEGTGEDLDASKVDKDYLLADSPNLVDNTYVGGLGKALVTGGGLSDNSSYNTTDYMPVVGGQNYTASPTVRFIQFFKLDGSVSGSLINVTGSTDPYTTPAPATAATARCSFAVGVWAKAQFEQGDTATEFKPFGKRVKPSLLPIIPPADDSIVTKMMKDNSVTMPKAAFLKASPNLFNKNAEDVVLLAILNSNGTVGAPGSNPSLNTSGFIPLKPNTTYTLGQSPRLIAFYDEGKTVIGTTTTLPSPYNPYTFTTGASVSYGRWSGSKSGSLWELAMLNEGDELLDYVDYGYTLDTSININGELPPYLKWNSEGDSITIQQKWQPAVASSLRLTLTNTGIGGTKMSGNVSPHDDESMWQDVRVNAIPIDTEVLTLLCGTNDWAQSAPLGDRASTDPATFNGALNVWLGKFRARCPNAQIFICGTMLGYRQSLTGFPNWADKYHNDLGLMSIDYGEEMRIFAQRNGLQYINFTAVGYDQYNIDNFIADGLHPNDAGAALLSKEAIATMKDRVRIN